MARSSEVARQLDQRLGGVIARALAHSKPTPRPESPRRIAFLQPTAIGDTLLSSGAVSAISKRYEDAEIIMLHGTSNAPAVNMIAADVRGMPVNFRNPVRAARELRALSPDIVVDLCPWPVATAIAARLSGAWTVGFQPNFGRRGQLFDLAIEHSTERHEIANLSALSEALGAGKAAQMSINRDFGSIPEYFRSNDMILMHVAAGGSRARAKSWPNEHWVKLIRDLVERGWRVGITGVAADADIVDPILQQASLPEDKAVSLCGKLSLQELAALLAIVPILVSVDTGVLHLSAAVEGTAIGLHGPTRSSRWGSVSPLAESLDAPHPAGGYINYGWEKHPQELAIMATLQPETVLSAIERKIGERSP